MYVAAGAAEKLVQVAERCCLNLEVGKAREIYTDAGLDFPKEKLIECGERLLASGRLTEARELYAAARLEVPTEKLVAARSEILMNGTLRDAREAYTAGELEIPKEELLRAADHWLWAVVLTADICSDVFDAYISTAAMAKLVDAGNSLVGRGMIEDARKFFGAAAALEA